jgi:hypothetical protein
MQPEKNDPRTEIADLRSFAATFPPDSKARALVLHGADKLDAIQAELRELLRREARGENIHEELVQLAARSELLKRRIAEITSSLTKQLTPEEKRRVDGMVEEEKRKQSLRRSARDN